MKKVVKLGSGSAYWGDAFEPAIELCERGDINYIGFDHLAELTMSILVMMRQRDPKRGYIPDMVELMRLCLPHCMRRGIKVITNMRAKSFRRSDSYRFGDEPTSGVENIFRVFAVSLFPLFVPVWDMFGPDSVLFS